MKRVSLYIAAAGLALMAGPGLAGPCINGGYHAEAEPALPGEDWQGMLPLFEAPEEEPELLPDPFSAEIEGPLPRGRIITEEDLGMVFPENSPGLMLDCTSGESSGNGRSFLL